MVAGDWSQGIDRRARYVDPDGVIAQVEVNVVNSEVWLSSHAEAVDISEFVP